MAKLRLGVIGAGSWTVASHLPNLVAHSDDIEFVGVARKGIESLERIADTYGFRVASEDYRDVLNAGIDICVVASPASMHFEHASAALDAGAHVLVEKPVTILPADAWKLVEHAKSVDRHMVVSFGWNYRPMICEAQRLASQPGIGTVEHVAISMASSTRELLAGAGAYPDAAPDTLPESKTWTNPSLSGGGYGQAQLSHALGLGLWLSGLRARSVFAMMASPQMEPVELHDAFVIEFTNGAIGAVSGASSHSGAWDDKHQLSVRFIGSDGQLHVDVGREEVWLYRSDGLEERLPISDGAGTYDCVGPINALVGLALGRPGVENRSPGELGARTVEILAAAYQSAARGTPQLVDGSE